MGVAVTLLMSAEMDGPAAELSEGLLAVASAAVSSGRASSGPEHSSTTEGLACQVGDGNEPHDASVRNEQLI